MLALIAVGFSAGRAQPALSRSGSPIRTALDLNLGVRVERIRRQDHAVHEREGARKRERHRAKNEHAGATEQCVQRVRDNVFGASGFVFDRWWSTRDVVFLPAASHEVLRSSYPDSHLTALNVCGFSGLEQLNSIPNCVNNFLDLVLFNVPIPSLSRASDPFGTS